MACMCPGTNTRVTDLGYGLVGPDEVGGSENEDSGPFGTLMNRQTDWLTKDSLDCRLRSQAMTYELVWYQVDPNELDNPRYPWYITNGAAGHYDGLDALVKPVENYSRFALDTAYGWSRLTFHNASHLTHEFVASANGSVLDTATLRKDRVKH
ncbi:Metallo-dependent phosphatase [Venturia nashicola]|nr:Metallo-dependent phosphatase [Venturia nashicola]